MRNRAKCKLCNSIIESFHSEDYVSCKCDEIAVYAGPAMRCAAKSFENFMRVDDEGNEIIVMVAADVDVKQLDISAKPTRKELLDMLTALISSIKNLPDHAMHAPVTHHDLLVSLQLVSSILRAEA